jgi:hypothetical protein
MNQLDSNLAALELPLSTDHIERLDKLSEPKLNFPAQYMKIAPSFSNSGATVNGIESAPINLRAVCGSPTLNACCGSSVSGRFRLQRLEGSRFVRGALTMGFESPWVGCGGQWAGGSSAARASEASLDGSGGASAGCVKVQ